MANEKILKIAEILGVQHLNENTQSIIQHTLSSMVKAIKENDNKVYAANLDDLLHYIGVSKLAATKVLKEKEIQDLVDKIKIMCEIVAKGNSNIETKMNDNFRRTLNTAKQLHEFYYKGSQDRNIKKINKDEFKWEASGAGTSHEFMNNTQGHSKMKVLYYDEGSMELEDGTKLTADKIMELLKKGYVLMKKTI